MTEVTIDEAGTIEVARAARMLDEDMPGWAEKINIHRLEMMSGSRCIAGQLGLDWNTLHWKLVEGREVFSVPQVEPFVTENSKPYWVKEINMRLKSVVKEEESLYVC